MGIQIDQQQHNSAWRGRGQGQASFSPFEVGKNVSKAKIGVENGTSKNVGLGKFCEDLEISEAFMISLEVSFFMVCFYFFESRNVLTKSLGHRFLTRISASWRVSDFTICHP